jgi:hypothetical protein
MKNSQINNRIIPKWLDNFITGLNKQSENENVVIADINVSSLPKIVWNDETFYVLFDAEKHNAKLYNRFGNEVTTIENVGSIEDVDKNLNSKQVVVTSEFDDELQKVIKAEDQVINTNTTPAPIDNQVQESQDPNTMVPETDPTQDITAEDIDEDIEKVGNTLDYMKRIADLEQQVQGLVQTVEELKGQLYARQDPGAIYDNNVADAEMQHVEETSKATADQIAQDNAIDITTMNGRVSLVDRLRDDLKSVFEEDESTESPIIEEPTTETIPETEVETIEKVVPETEVIDENPTTEIEETETEEDTTEENEEDNKDNKNNKEGIIELGEKDTKIFKKAICPYCGEDGLTKAASVNSFIGVYCKHCTAEYAVNIDTETIYKKN